MNKPLLFSTLFYTLTISVSNTALAHPEYLFPAKAMGCSDCHIGDTRSKNWVPGIIESFPVDQTLPIQGKIDAIQALTTEQKAPALAAINKLLNPAPTSPDTNPVLSSPSNTWDITVGEGPLNIPYSVADTEDDGFTVNGNALTVSEITVDDASQLQNFTLSWTPDAVHAGQTYTLNTYVRENQRSIGRFLMSNAVKSSIRVWPARANAATAQVGQFELYNAQWAKNTLTLSGKVDFKANVTDAQQAAALASLPLNLSSQKGKAIGLPPTLIADDTGLWTVSLSLPANQVPCTLTADYEGLKAQRPVVGAPKKCVK